MQRSFVVAGVAFVFFLIMMGVYYARQWFVYFLLATSFLIVNLFTLVGLWLQRRNNLTLYEDGLVYKKETVLWDDVTRLRLEPASGLTLSLAEGRELIIPAAITGLPVIAAHIDLKRKHRSSASK